MLFVHLIGLIHVFDVEIQAMRHHAARINETTLFQGHHILNVGGGVRRAGTRGRDNRGLLVHPRPRVHWDNVAPLDTKNDHAAKLTHQTKRRIERLRIARGLDCDIWPFAAGNLLDGLGEVVFFGIDGVRGAKFFGPL